MRTPRTAQGPAAASAWTQQALIDHLQDAVELELFTIPLYLCAMYSITPAAQSETGNQAYTLIQSVVNEEMLHLELACNTLNAVGGNPVLTQGTSGQAAPSYPENIPFIQPPSPAQLGPMTPAQNLVFMAIELPTWDDPNHDIDTGPEPAYDTIGEFYDAIEAGLNQINQFPGSTTLQASGVFPDDVAVTNLTTALQALNLIVSQGEGTSATDPLDSEGNPGHYDRFANIASNLQWITGTTSNGSLRVYDMIVNPNGLSYSSNQGNLLKFFDGCFSYLLKWLETDFNGNPGDLGSGPVGAMFSVIDPLMTYVIQQTYDQPNQPQTGMNLTPRFNYVPITYDAQGIKTLQGLYCAMASADQTGLAAVASALSLSTTCT